MEICKKQLKIDTVPLFFKFVDMGRAHTLNALSGLW